ncbi:DUF7344 domain-containing protein [Halomarina oriensis]|uniref:DUF7344 domain-containing protein n=1 Tax=Halomarina oriensis TaxID=671145 RepID=A0A6B0GHM9_9EURY|nr:hypothetical protein [Halomarina oriensis]MWG34234.1 hypothetical protein [Halomarina oriensis]
MAGTSMARASPETDRIYRLVADDERRTLLGVLADTDRVAVEDLRVAITDDDGDPQHADIRLHHVHLPKLEDADLVRRDDDAVGLTDRGHTVADRVDC